MREGSASRTPSPEAGSAVRTVHTVADLADASGGPSRSVTRLADGLARAGGRTEIVTSASDGPEIEPREAVAVHHVPMPSWTAFVGRPTAFEAAVQVHARAGAVVHDHGLWLPSNVAAARAARRSGVPLVVSLKGAASRWALQHRRAKKAVAWRAYQKRVLAGAALLQVTSDSELDDAHRLGVGTPVALVRHGVEVPPEPEMRERPGLRRALFLSRLHPGKGLAMLIEAWARVAPDGWELTIAGPDEDGHRAEIEQQARQAGLNGAVRCIGPVPDAEKWDLYASADLFVLPTRSENFGIVVAEALATGIPVLTTKGAPWSVIDQERCGWWTDVDTDAITAALAEATTLDDDALRAAGARGRAYVLRELTWDRAAREMNDLYRWILGRGSRPASVIDPASA
ncbi:MAG: glycosyltransferase [Bacteroidota bacterium]